MNILGVDIGGSAVKAAPVDVRTGRLLAPRRQIETPVRLAPAELAGAVAALVREFRWTGRIGVGCPGIIHGSRIITVANLHPDFIGCDLGRLLQRATGRPVAVANDAAAAAMAEMKFGAGQGFAGKVLILTLGTGVGSALAYQGVVFPCELGQLRWRRGTAERLVAASARERERLSWSEWGGRLRDYVGFLEEMLWPELIIIGGGVSASHARYFRYIRARAALLPAEFFNEAGIVGAALCGTGGPIQPARRTRRVAHAFRYR